MTIISPLWIAPDAFFTLGMAGEGLYNTYGHKLRFPPSKKRNL
jgi:hypothetical protein